MMVAEELQCDWSKVRPQYASANRDAREKAPAWTLKVPGNGAADPTGGGVPTFGNRDRVGVSGIPDSLYRRMRTNAASSVKDGRYYLQLAGAEARERLLLAAAAMWNVPVSELTAKNSVITHAASGRRRPTARSRPSRGNAASTPRDDHHQVAGPVDADGHRAEEPRRAVQGDRSGDLRHRRAAARHEVGGRQDLPGLWRRREALRLRGHPPHAGRAVGDAVPDSRSGADPRPHLQRRRRRRSPTRGIRRRRRSTRCRSNGTFLPSTRRSRAPTCATRCSRRSIGRARCARAKAMWMRRSRTPRGSSKRPTRHRSCRAPAWSLATRRCSSPTTAWTSGSAIRARRKPASAPPGSRAFQRPTCTCTCAIWAAASAATATGRRPSTRS